MAIAGPLYPGVFRVLAGLSNTLGMLHKPYRIKKRQRCPLNFTELKSVKDASSSFMSKVESHAVVRLASVMAMLA